MADALSTTPRFYVHDFSGAVAATRHKGKIVAEHIRRIDADATIVEVSFEGVEVATPSFMDEVRRAVQELRERAIYSCLNEDVAATLTFCENREARR